MTTPSHIGWPVLQRLLAAAFDRAALPRPEALDKWMTVAAKVGPTPPRGPLTHDVVLPHRNGARAVGLNIFRLGRAEALDLALGWVRDSLGTPAAEVLVRLIDAVPQDVEVNPGAYVDAQGARLKLYFGSPSPDALSRLGATLAVETSPVTRGLAVDLRAEGLERAREYRKIEPRDMAARSDAAAAWASVSRQDTQMRHCMLGTRPASERAPRKHALVQTFAPDAPLSVLVDFESALIAAGAQVPRPVDAGWLEMLRASIASEGFTLRSVAHELDLHENGTVHTDVFVTVGSAAHG